MSGNCFTKTLLLGLFGFMLASVAGCANRDDEVARQLAKTKTSKPIMTDRQKFNLAKQAIDKQRYEEALTPLRGLLIAHPDDPEVIMTIARCEAAMGRLDDAVATLDAMTKTDARPQLEAIGQAVSWLIDAKRYDDAEKRLLDVINNGGDFAVARRRLAQILNNQGRRIEAAPHMQKLAENGDISEAELYGMNCWSDLFVHELDLEVMGSKGIPLTGLGEARLLRFEGKLREAEAFAMDLATRQPESTSVAAFRGRLYADMGDYEGIARWMRGLPAGIEQEPDYWYTQGVFYQSQDNSDVAVRCFLEAVSRDETDRFAYLALARSLDIIGKPEASAAVMEHYNRLHRSYLIVSELKRTDQQLAELIIVLRGLGRDDEARGWRKILTEKSMDRVLKDEAEASLEGQSGQQYDPLCGLKLEDWPLPIRDSAGTSEISETSANYPVGKGMMELRDVAGDLGIDFRYLPNRDDDPNQLRMHETVGGGIAATDFDLDGWPDLYFIQSGGDPRKPKDSMPNRLYRNLDGKRFVDTTDDSQTGDRGYGQGIGVTDINQDGFPDFIVGNIGPNVVYLNHGDGTFGELPVPADTFESLSWTTSIACGDLDGDHLPDVLEIHYIDDDAALDGLCSGRTRSPQCNPQNYRPGKNRILWNAGNGRMNIRDTDNPAIPAYGFAALIGNIDNREGNDWFIANDTDDNQYWVSERETSPSPQARYRHVEQATLRGCAVGSLGLPQSCMGLAQGDFNHDGRMDLHITNYTDESSDLFLQQSSGLFSNQFSRYGLDLTTKATMGWGTQSADFDNDGWLDLAILNGNLYHDANDGSPYRMPPQCFRGAPNQFVPVEPTGDNVYWTTPALGRTLATTDWNRDGRIDMVAGHLDAKTAMLENQSDSGNWIALELCGTESERDAIGAVVTVQRGSLQWTRWVVGGGGYLTHNLSMVHVGIGELDTVDSVEIQWPSGRLTRVDGPPINHAYLAIEDQEEMFSR